MLEFLVDVFEGRPTCLGLEREATRVVRSEHVPNIKYGPEDDFARNKGVVKAMIQLTT